MSKRLAIFRRDGRASVLTTLGARPSRELGAVGRRIGSSRQWSMFSNPSVAAFEDDLSRFLGAPEVAFVSSGTAALQLALIARGVRPGDTVIVPAVGYVAVPNAVRAAGAHPIFSDIDRRTFALSVASVRQAASELGGTCKAAISIDLFGLACSKEEFVRFEQDSGIAFIEDCAHSFGAQWQERRSGTFGTGCFSFSEGKNFSTGEGGAVASIDPEIIRRVKIMRHEGEIWSKGKLSAAEERVHSFQPYLRGRITTSVGFNFRPSAFAAAVGNAQLPDVEMINAKRRRVVECYRRVFGDFEGIQLQDVPPGALPAWNRFVIAIDSKRLCLSRDSFVAALLAEGVPVGVYRSQPLYDFPAFLGSKPKHHLKNAVWFCKNSLQFPVSARLRLKEILSMRDIVERILTEARRYPGLDAEIRSRAARIRFNNYTGEYVIPPVSLRS